MLIVQILLVPVFALILLASVFLIGVSSVTPPFYDNHTDETMTKTDELAKPGSVI
jgi:hypothetical protein